MGGPENALRMGRGAPAASTRGGCAPDNTSSAFNRRNAAGVELLTSYEAATGNKLAEGLGRQLGGLLVIVGILLAVFGYVGGHH